MRHAVHCTPSTTRRLPGDGKARDAADPASADPREFLHAAFDPEAGELADHPTDGDLRFDAREIGPQAEVGAVPEGDVLVVGSRYAARVRSWEVLGIVVRGHDRSEDSLPHERRAASHEIRVFVDLPVTWI